MKRLLPVLIISAALAQTASAAAQRELIPMAKGDTVAFILTVPPKSTEAFHIYRQGPLPTTDEFILLTEGNPVRPVIDANQVQAVLGGDWPVITRALATTDPFEVLRKLRGDEFVGITHSLISNRVAQLTGRWYLDPTAQHGAEYIYKIVIIDSRGREIDSVTRQVSVTEVYPDAPSGLKTETSDGRVTLSWDYDDWRGDYNDLAVQFLIWRSSHGATFEVVNEKPILRNDAERRDYFDLWLTNGVEYAYYITATDPIGRQSATSDTVRVTPVDDVPPAILEAPLTEVGDGVVAISWNMSPELDVAGYLVTRSRGLDKEFYKLNHELVPPGAPIYYDSTIDNGVQYFYSIIAIDASGNESRRSNAMSAIGEDKTPPDAPTNLVSEVEVQVIKLSWTPSVAEDVMGYYVYRGLSDSIQPRVTNLPISDTVYIDSGFEAGGLTPGRLFTISVAAADKSRNESEKITIEVLIPDNVPPIPPQAFLASNVEGRYIDIHCGGSPSLDVAKYRFFRSEGPADSMMLAQFDDVPLRYRDSAITRGQEYVYYALAWDTAGNQSEPSRVDTILVRDFASPPSPRNVSAKKTETGISIKWERVVDFDLVGYNVYRSDLPTGIFTILNDSPVEGLEFADPAGTTTHYYRVRAIDTSGNESTRGDAVHAR